MKWTPPSQAASNVPEWQMLISLNHEEKRVRAQITTAGLDLAKNVFQFHAVARKASLPFFANPAPRLIGLEAQGASNYRAREPGKPGHAVRLMSPRFVKPYIKSSKNDQNDAEAIC